MKPQSRVALPTAFTFAVALIALALSTRGADSSPGASPGDAQAPGSSSNAAISPQDQADALHFVIATDRELYCREYSARPGNSWPSPSEMLRRAAESIQIKGAEFSYALRSLRSVDERNGPQTELEQRGLAFVKGHPNQNYYGREMLGGRRYFTAVYPDLPAAGACVYCHNRRSASTPQRHQVGEIMGAIVVRVPLEF